HALATSCTYWPSLEPIRAQCQLQAERDEVLDHCQVAGRAREREASREASQVSIPLGRRGFPQPDSCCHAALTPTLFSFVQASGAISVHALVRVHCPDIAPAPFAPLAGAQGARRASLDPSAWRR